MKAKEMEPPLAKLVAIGFDIMMSDEIIMSSVFDVHESTRGSKIFSDARLGFPNSEGECGTCKLVNAEEHKCPGHFGHFSLSSPVLNPQHVNQLVRLLNSVCPACGKAKVRKERRVKQMDISEQTVEESMRTGDCKYCKSTSDVYPKLEFKVVPKRIENVDVDSIEMHAVDCRNQDFPLDFWSFVDRSKDDPESPRLMRPLLPEEALQILGRVREDSFRKTGLALRPDCMIIKEICIPPNFMRFLDGLRLGQSIRRLERGEKTRSLMSILSKNNSFKQGHSDLYAAQKKAMELQAKISNYYDSLKMFSNEKQQSTARRKGFQVIKKPLATQKSGPTWFKTNVLGKRSHYSALGVIAGDSNINLQELAVPSIVAENLKVPEWVTDYNIDKLQNLVDNSLSRFSITRDGEKWCMLSGIPSTSIRLQVGDVIERPLLDDDLIFVNRPPTIHMHSLVGFKVRIDDRHTFGLNPIMCRPFSADFDGDTAHIFVPQSLEARAEISEMLNVSKQLVSPQGGKTLLRLSEDGSLSLHLILNKHFWLNKHEVQMLNMYCEHEMPRPALVKAPKIKGSLWTGLQVLSMSIPSYIDHIESNSVVVCNGEILRCPPDNYQWLTEGIVSDIVYQTGPQEALEFLTVLQNVLHQWLLHTGFSVGLKDMLLTDNLASRKKLLGIVGDALEEAKEGSRKALQLASLNMHLKSIAFESHPMGSNVPDIMRYNADMDDIAIKEFLAVFKEIQTVVERHIFHSNFLLAMVKAGSKGSLPKLVQQCVCLGLQLYNKRRWFPTKMSLDDAFSEYAGIVESSFVSGLNVVDFLSHLISIRGLPKGHGIEVSGELFRDCMFALREVCLAYDGSVRTRCESHVIQLCYEGSAPCGNEAKSIKSEWTTEDVCAGGEAVGVLAVNAVIEPAYNYTFDKTSPARLDPVILLKDVLTRGGHTGLKAVDFISTLHISSQAVRRKSDRERAALQIQDHLRCVMLESLPLSTIIECNLHKGDSSNPSPWTIHFHISKTSMKKAHLKVGDVLASFLRQSSEIFSCSDICQYGGDDEACVRVSFGLTNNGEGSDGSLSNNILLKHLNVFKYYIIPTMLKSVIKGSPTIKSATVNWRDFEDPLNPSHTDIARNGSSKEKEAIGEVVVDVGTIEMSRRGRAWDVVKELCSGIFDMIDWKRSAPQSIPEVHSTFGIEAARKLIYERLRFCVREMSSKVHDRHLALIADYMTHTGDVLAYNASGFKRWNKMMDISAPFTEGALKNPRGIYFDAARRRRTEKLCGMLGSLVWGRYDGTGCDNFDMIWSPNSKGTWGRDCVTLDSGQQERDVLDFLMKASERDASQRAAARMEETFEAMDIEDHGDVMNVDGDCNPALPPGFEPASHCSGPDNIATMDTQMERAYMFDDPHKLVTLDAMPPGFGHSSGCDLEFERAKMSPERDFAGIDQSSNISQLASLVQSMLHHRYCDGEELSQRDYELIMSRVLVHHPNKTEKIGCGASAIKVGHSEEHPESRCFVVVRKDGSSVDFSYHKCLRNIPGS